MSVSDLKSSRRKYLAPSPSNIQNAEESYQQKYSRLLYFWLSDKLFMTKMCEATQLCPTLNRTCPPFWDYKFNKHNITKYETATLFSQQHFS